MAQARTVIGLDVHAAKIVAATLDTESGELMSFSLGGSAAEAAKFCAALPAPARATYEAGPTGYGLARELARCGVGCVVAAPAKIPRASGERVKTDRRDAEHLARMLLAGKLSPVRVPGCAEEALRDLVRARLSKLLLRRGLRYEGKTSWNEAHLAWLAAIELDERAAQTTLTDYRGAIESLLHRRAELEREIAALVPGSSWEREVALLRCLRGIDTLSAVGLCAEIGDFRRFARAGQLMHYVGLVPSESSSGQQRRLGSITKTGSRHARRLLAEAGWHYRRQPNVAKGLAARQQAQPAEAVAISWSAQRRLHRTWTRLRDKGKRPGVAAVAVARELAGFCWSISRVEG